MTSPTYDQLEYRFENDDGDENGASFAGDLNSSISVATGTSNKRRIRVQLFNDNGKNGNITVVWERNNTTQGTGWGDVTTGSTHIQAVASDNVGVVEGDTLTNNLTNRGANFDGDGNITVDGTGTGYTHNADQYAEHSLVFYVTSDAASGDTIQIRARLSGGETVTYTNTPSLTVASSASDNQAAYTRGSLDTSDNNAAYVEGVTGTFSKSNKSAYVNGFTPTGLYQRGFRWRPEGATATANDNTTWEAAENTNVTLDMLPRYGGLLTNLRVEIGAYDTVGSVTPKLEYRKNGGSWAAIRDWNYVAPNLEASPYDEVMCANKASYTDGAATTNILTTATEAFTAGTHEHNNTAAAVTLNTQHTELEWQILISRTYETRQLNSDGDYFEFRVTNNGTPFTTYDPFPRVTVNMPSGYLGGVSAETSGGQVMVATPGGTLYTTIEDTELQGRIMMHKSTDGGVTWTGVDTGEVLADTDQEGLAMVYDDTNKVIHVAHFGGNVNYYQFGTEDHSTTADQWITANAAVIASAPTAVNQNCDIIIRGSNVYFFYEDSAQVWYRKKADLTTGSWATAVSIDTSGGGTSFTGVMAALGPNSNKIHIFYNEDAAWTMYHRSLDSGDSLGTIHTVESDMPTSNDSNNGLVNAVAWYDGTTEKAMIAYVDETNGYLYSVIVEDDGTPNTRQNVSNSVVGLTDPVGINSRQPVASLALYENTVFCLWADDATEDVWITSNSNGAGWSTPREVIDGESTHMIRGTIFRHSSGNGGNLVYGWIRDEPIEPGGTPNWAGYTGSPSYYEVVVGADDSKSAYVEGASAGTPASDSQAAYTAGSLDVSDNQSAYTAGGLNVSDNQPAYTAGSLNVSDNQAAYTAGTDTASDNKSAYTAGTDTASDNKSAYTAGTDTASDSKSAYTAGSLDVFDNQVAYTAGGLNVSDNQLAYTAGGLNVSDNQVAYTAGVDTASDNKSAYTEGKLGANSSQAAYTAGTDTASDNKSAYTAGGLNVSDNQVAYTAGTDAAADNKSAYTAGGLNVSDNQVAYTAGVDTASDNKSAYTEGKLGANSRQAAYTAGTDTAADNKSAYTAGGLNVADSKPAYTVGVAGATDNKSAYTAGVDTASDSKSVYTAGVNTSVDSKSAYAVGSIDADSRIAAYTAGVDTASDSKSAYTSGIAGSTDNKSAYTAGVDTASDNKSAYVAGSLDVADSKSAYTTATASAADNKSAYTAGIDTAADNKSAYTVGGINVSSSKSAYVNATGNIASDNKSAYTAGIDTTSDNKSAFVAGSLDVSDNQQAYAVGVAGAVDNKSAYTSGVDTAADSKSAYVAGSLDATSNQQAYVAGSVNVNDSKSAYTEGVSAESISNKSAYTAGSLAVSSNQEAYVSGVDTASDSKEAYVVGSLASSDNKSAYVVGVDTASDSKEAYVVGVDTASDSKEAYVAGVDTASDSRSAYVVGIEATSASLPAYTVGQSASQDSKSAYVAGALGASSSQAAYLEGTAEAQDRATFKGMWRGMRKKMR